MKESGSGNRVGSRQIVHAARLTLVYLSAEVSNVGLTPPGMEWPPKVVPSGGHRRVEIGPGTGGYNLKVSRMTAFKRGNFSNSAD